MQQSCTERKSTIRGIRRLPVPPEGLVCATKLHGAKIDGPAVAGLSFFAKRCRTKLHPETVIKVRSGLFSFVLISLISQKMR